MSHNADLPILEELGLSFSAAFAADDAEDAKPARQRRRPWLGLSRRALVAGAAIVVAAPTAFATRGAWLNTAPKADNAALQVIATGTIAADSWKLALVNTHGKPPTGSTCAQVVVDDLVTGSQCLELRPVSRELTVGLARGHDGLFMWGVVNANVARVHIPYHNLEARLYAIPHWTGSRLFFLPVPIAPLEFDHTGIHLYDAAGKTVFDAPSG